MWMLGRPTLGCPLLILGDMEKGGMPPFFLMEGREGVHNLGQRYLMLMRVRHEELIITWGGLVWI